MGTAKDQASGATYPAERQHLRDEIDDGFDHTLGTFPLVFPETDEGWPRA